MTEAAVLQDAALAVSSARGERVFQQLVEYLATTLDVELAMIGELVGTEPERVRTRAVCYHGRIIDDFEYALAGTPCQNVVGRSYHYIPSGVAARYRGDELLQRYGYDSYAAYPLFDTRGQALGLIVVMDHRPLAEPELTESLLKIFSVRAAAELERRQAEDQLRQARKMEALGQLTGGIAHDFNNILTTILGYALLARERAAPLHDAKLADYLEQIQQAGERARELIQQMLTFSRGRRGEPRRLNLPNLVKESMRLLGASFPASIDLIRHFSPDVRPVLADPVQLEQVLINLCINARDALAGKGRIEIGVTEREEPRLLCSSCGSPVHGVRVELAVADDGPGIQAPVLARMFEPFFTTKETGKGSGMGLAMAHGIVHEYGGHIVVETTPGAGTRFRVLLPPAEDADPLLPDLPPVARAPGRPVMAGRVLVVDDEPGIGGFLHDLLTGRGLQVTLSSDAPEALALFDNGAAFDLVITDQTMPGMSGMDLARELLQRRPDLPIILCTGYSERLSEAAVLAAGLRGLLKKPVDVERLMGMIRLALI